MSWRPLGLAATAWGAVALVWIAGSWLVCHGAQCADGGLDRALLAWFGAQRTPALDLFYAAATWIGSLYLLLPLGLAAAVLLVSRGRRGAAAFLLLALGGAALLARLIKASVARPRPELLAAMPADLSYPSAHAAQIAAFVAAALILACRALPDWKFPLVVVGVSLAGAVCVSRLYLQVHYPSDVLAGIAVGLAWVLGLYALLRSAAGR